MSPREISHTHTLTFVLTLGWMYSKFFAMGMSHKHRETKHTYTLTHTLSHTHTHSHTHAHTHTHTLTHTDTLMIIVLQMHYDTYKKQYSKKQRGEDLTVSPDRLGGGRALQHRLPFTAPQPPPPPPLPPPHA